jgi:hypothetical protein
MKQLTPAVKAAILSKSTRHGFLAKIDTFAGFKYFWSGIGTLAFDGQSWIGLGALGRISGMGETVEVRTTETRYELSGISDNPALSDFLSEPIRGKIARAWIAFMTADFEVIPDPIQIDESILDVAAQHIGEDLLSVLSLIGTSAIFDFPGDTGFDRVPTEVADKQVPWTNT